MRVLRHRMPPRRITNADRLDAIGARLGVIERILLFIVNQGGHEMATLNDIRDAVAAEKTVEDSIITLLGQIAQQLKDAIASNDPAAMQQVVDDLTAHRQALADAVTANTTPPPAP